MSLSKEREEEIKAAIKKEVWGTNSFGLDVITEESALNWYIKALK